MIRIAQARAGIGDRGVQGAHFHPAGQIGNLPVRQFAVLGHFQVVVDLTDGQDQAALVGLARDDCRARVAAAQEGLARIQPQFGPLLLGTVALMALLAEHRADVGLEETHLLGRRRRDAGRLADRQN